MNYNEEKYKNILDIKLNNKVYQLIYAVDKEFYTFNHNDIMIFDFQVTKIYSSDYKNVMVITKNNSIFQFDDAFNIQSYYDVVFDSYVYHIECEECKINEENDYILKVLERKAKIRKVKKLINE